MRPPTALRRRVGPIPFYAIMAVIVVVVASLAIRSGGGGPRCVVTTPAGPRTINQPFAGLGQSTAGQDFPVTLPFTAQVLTMDVVPGQPVSKGQGLFSVDLGNAQSNVAALKVREQLDNATLSQLNADLVKPSNAAATTALQARIDAVTARVGLDHQLVDIAQGQANPTILAPTSGTVGTVSINVNQQARPNLPVLDILDLSTIKVTANFPVADVAVLHAGAPATLEFGDIGDVTLKGSVIAVSAQANPGGQDVQVIAQAPNASGQLVRAGLSAFVRVPITTDVPVAVSKLAVLDATNVPTALVVTGGVAHVHKLVLGVSDGHYYEVKSGLSAGDECVIVGNNGLSDGAKVRVAETQR